MPSRSSTQSASSQTVCLKLVQIAAEDALWNMRVMDYQQLEVMEYKDIWEISPRKEKQMLEEKYICSQFVNQQLQNVDHIALISDIWT